MRRYLLEGIAADHPEVSLPEIDKGSPDAIARAALVRTQGAKCAAWLVGTPMPKGTKAERERQERTRRMLRKSGAIRFELWKKQKLPMWIYLAFRFLQDRAGWEVDIKWERKGLLQVFLVKWINRGHFRGIVRRMRSAA